MVTRAVGDRFGSGGIADRYIRVNGYPFLEKEDHVYGVPGKKNSPYEVEQGGRSKIY